MVTIKYLGKKSKKKKNTMTKAKQEKIRRQTRQK